MTVVPLGPPALSPDGRLVLQGGLDGAGRVVDLRDGSVAAVLRAARPAEGAGRLLRRRAGLRGGFSSDGRHVATVSFDGAARVWDWRARRLVATPPRCRQGSPRVQPRRPHARRRRDAVGLAPRPPAQRSGASGRTRFARASRSIRRGAMSPARRCSAARACGTCARAARSRELPAAENDDATESVAFSPDARRLARGTSDGVAEVWDWRRSRGSPGCGRAAGSPRRASRRRRDACSSGRPAARSSSGTGRPAASSPSCAGIAGLSPASRSRPTDA